MTLPPPPRRPEPHFHAGDDAHPLSVSHDQVLVLFELLERLEEERAIAFAHPAEAVALGSLHGQLLPLLWEVFDPDYQGLLREARARLGAGYEGDVEGLGPVRVEPDGSLTRLDPE